MRSIQNLESSRDDKKRALSCLALKKKKRNRIDIPLDVYVFFIISRLIFISLYLSQKNWERKSRWILSPISNTKSYLLIERSSSNTGAFFLGIPHIQSSLPQAPHLIRLVGGAVRLLNQTTKSKVSSRGFIATFILKESEESTFSQ